MLPSRLPRLVLLAWLATLPSCASGLSLQRAEDDAWTPTTTVSTSVAVIESPWDERDTALWRVAVETQALLVAELLDVEFEPELRVRFVPVALDDPTGDPLRDGIRAAGGMAGHVGGYFSPDRGTAGTVVVYVPEHPVTARIGLDDRMSTLRHELSHALGRQRFGDDAAMWFDEGLARVVEELDQGPPRWGGIAPLTVLRAPIEDGPAVVEDLLAWRPVQETPRDSWRDEARRYDQAGALVFFLLSHERGSFARRCGIIAELPDEALRGAADAFAIWRAPIDPYVDLARGMRHADVEVRREAMLRLRQLALDPDHWQVIARLPHVELSVLLLDDERTFAQAAGFLLETAADRVSSQDVAALASSTHNGKFLVGQALLARRGEQPDRVAVAQIWAETSTSRQLFVYPAVMGALDLVPGDVSAAGLAPITRER